MEKITFCTISKNRLHHLKQTLLENIQNVHDLKNTEFLILDYNSDDGLDSWIRDNCMKLIEQGILTYYKNSEVSYFHRSHSRNLAFRLASGHIIANVDADSYIGQYFDKYIREVFENRCDVFMCAGGMNDNISASDVGGKICVRKSDFIKVQGFDEAMDGYGFEDFDLINRLNTFLKKELIRNPKYLGFISHSIKESISGEYLSNNMFLLLIRYDDFLKSEILILLNDKRVVKGTLKTLNYTYKLLQEFSFNNNEKSSFGIEEGFWEKGKYNFNYPNLELNFKKSTTILTQWSKYKYVNDLKRQDYFIVENEQLTQQIIFVYTHLANRQKMEWNEKNKIIAPNKYKFGQGTVYKNFDFSQPITQP